jgi:alpha-glucosidase
MYREALRLRREWQTEERLDWPGDNSADVLRFTRPGGWLVVTNFSTGPVAVPGRVLLSSGPLTFDGRVPRDTTVWVDTRTAGA